MWDQVALHDKLKRIIAFHIDGVSLLALHGGEDRDNSTAMLFVFIDDVTDRKFWHQTFRIMNRVWTNRPYGPRDVRFAQSARNDRLPMLFIPKPCLGSNVVAAVRTFANM